MRKLRENMMIREYVKLPLLNFTLEEYLEKTVAFGYQVRRLITIEFRLHSKSDRLKKNIFSFHCKKKLILRKASNLF